MVRKKGGTKNEELNREAVLRRPWGTVGHEPAVAPREPVVFVEPLFGDQFDRLLFRVWFEVWICFEVECLVYFACVVYLNVYCF